jgi:putative nucleotidyltransferase with HDIG domain
MDQTEIQNFRAEVIAQRNLPTIPTVLTRILSLVGNEEASARELVDVIERDQALTGRILRLANSAFFGQSRQVATIPRAIMLLGFSTVRNLSLGVKVWEAVAGKLARQRVEELWGHAVTVAVLTRTLAVRLRCSDPDEAFTAGLLHDVGRVIIASRFREAYWDAVGGASEAEPVTAIEQASFAVDHAEVGAWLFEAWNLPPAIVEAVREHHEADPKPGLPALLAATNSLVAWTDFNSGTVRPEAAAIFAAQGESGVTEDAWTRLVAEVHQSGGASSFGAFGS